MTDGLRISLLGWMVLCLLVAPACDREPREPSPAPRVKKSAPGKTSGNSLAVGLKKRSQEGAKEIAAPVFSEVQDELGIDFVYQPGHTGKMMMVEVTGGGAGWLDFDRDGFWDLYLVQGGNPAPAPDEVNPTNHLYRNLDGAKFINETTVAAVADRGYGQGVAIGDFDEDGFDDIYVTNVGANVLYQNMGDGSFTEVTQPAGVADNRWGSSAAWGDLDHDGDLDLFLCNYLLYDPYHPYPCFTDDGKPSTCHPTDLKSVHNECFENLGDGTFRAVSSEWGLRGEGSKSLGVVIADFNEDGRIDIFVANDTTANFLFMNQGKGNFKENAIPLGCAIRGDGNFQASMGIAFGDYDRNGFGDLYVTHFTEDYNTLYANLGPSGFHDATQFSGLHQPTMKYLGFGTVMADFDLNGQEDLVVTNGHIADWRDRGLLWQMPAQVFTYTDPRWVECTPEQSGEFFQKPLIGRGLASCDYDGDGDLDLAIVHHDAPMALLRNEAQGNHWLNVRLIGTASNRRGIGAVVHLQQVERSIEKHLAGGTSYLATHEPALNFGLGTSDAVCSLEIRWPSGLVQTVENVAPDQLISIREPMAEIRTRESQAAAVQERADQETAANE